MKAIKSLLFPLGALLAALATTADTAADAQECAAPSSLHLQLQMDCSLQSSPDGQGDGLLAANRTIDAVTSEARLVSQVIGAVKQEIQMIKDKVESIGWIKDEVAAMKGNIEHTESDMGKVKDEMAEIKGNIENMQSDMKKNTDTVMKMLAQLLDSRLAKSSVPLAPPTPTTSTISHLAPTTPASACRIALECAFPSVLTSDTVKDVALVKAAMLASEAEVLRLLANGARDSGYTALHWAAQRGLATAARQLLARGACVHARDWWGTTPLHKAVWKGHSALVQILLAAGADPNAVRYDGGTPLHNAAMEGQEHVVRLLVAAGARADVKRKDGRTPFDVATTDAIRNLLRG